MPHLAFIVPFSHPEPSTKALRWFFQAKLTLQVAHLAQGRLDLITIPSHLLGRIMSLLLIAAALHYIGALPLGVIADNLSWPISISYGALSFLLVVLVLRVWRPNIRRLRV